MITALGYIGIAASDLAAWHSFATNILGLMASERDGGLDLRLDSRTCRIRIEPGQADDIVFVGWEVADKAALEDVTARIIAAGVPASPDPALAARRRVRELVRFTDPAGITGELHYGPTERFETPFLSPTGVSGFVTGDQGLGHFALATIGAEAYVAFYRAIGFAVSDYIDMPLPSGGCLPLTFLHCNPRHHTFAVAPAPAPKRALHLMIQAQTVDDVGLTLERAHRAKVPVAMSLGRHSNDHMLSFYLESPSGFEFEFGTGARTIGQDWKCVRHDTISIWGHKGTLAGGGTAG